MKTRTVKRCRAFSAFLSAVVPGLVAVNGVMGQVSIEKPVMVKNINAAPSTAANVHPMIEVNGVLFFTAYTAGTGWELWKSDGTEVGTVLVKDINPGPGAYWRFNAPGFVANVNGTLFLVADDGVNGLGLWKSDGTGEGTVRVSGMVPTPEGSPFYADDSATVNGVLFFLRNGELWKSDGTAAGTVRIAGAPTGVTSLASGNDVLFFHTDDELWKTDGSEGGTVRLVGAKVLGPLVNVTGVVFFVSRSDTGVALWKSDGTPWGTLPVKPDLVPPDVRMYYHGAGFNGRLFLAEYYYDTQGNSQGARLWRSDGTAEGTVVIKSFSESVGIWGARGQSLFFSADSALWKTDGTAEGTVRAHPISVDFYFPILLNGEWFYWDWSQDLGWGLWKTDGSAAGPVLVKADNFRPQSALVRANGSLFFGDSGTNGMALWKSDGTASGTIPVKTVDPSLNGGIRPELLGSAGGRLYFNVNARTESSSEIWASDGTEEGTFLLRSGSYSPTVPVEVNETIFYQLFSDEGTPPELWKITPGSTTPRLVVERLLWSTSWPDTNSAGSLFFWASAPSGGATLWKSDGTDVGTVPIADIPGADGVQASLDVNGTLFFATWHSLWKTDGTRSGTSLVKNFTNAGPTQLVNAGGKLHFTVLRESIVELWKSDGTEQGTMRISTSEFLWVSHLTAADGTLFFIHHPQGGAVELWKSDGTDEGTVPVKTFGHMSDLVEVNGTLLFSAWETNGGASGLWKSDGTQAGTFLVNNQPFIVYWSINTERHYFWAYEIETETLSLWKTDGSREGTTRIKAFPGAGYLLECNSPKLLNVNGTLWFFTLGDSGRELWRSDGTEEGTVRVLASVPDLNSCMGFGGFFELVSANGVLFFIADDDINGVELWKFGDPDGDSDGLPDWWEDKFFAGAAEATSDSDADGLTNWQESRAGTDPNDPNSVLRFSKVERLGPPKLRLQWQSALNHEYVLLRSSVLSTNAADYRVIARRVLATPPLNSFVDTTADAPGPYFYRLKLEN